MGRVLGVVGLMLAIGAGLAFVLTGDTDAGDSRAIESALTSQAERSPPPVASPGPVATIASQREPDPVPLWSANESSHLEDLTGSKRIPVGLTIESLQVDAPVEPYGIDERTGQMAVPRNARDVAWYEHGPSPGESGSAVLAAHVDLKSQGPGVFFGLRELDPGETIVVTFDDGTSQPFEVRARDTYQKEELPLDAIFSREGPSVLTLITCGGGFSASSQSYDSNVVVYATPISGPAAGSFTS